MDQPTPGFHLDLLLRPDATSIEGTVLGDDGTVSDFTGWLGLMSTIQNIIAPSGEAEEATT